MTPFSSWLTGTIFSPFLSFILLAMLATTANDCCPDGPVKTPKETFMIAYTGPNEQVMVRYSNDNLSWAGATVPGAISDAGVGAASSLDGIGVYRAVAHTMSIGKLRYRYGLGPATWDSRDIEQDVRLSYAPKVAFPIPNETSTLLISLVQYSPRLPRIYKHMRGQSLLDVSPGEFSSMANTVLQRAPSIIVNYKGTVLAAWTVMDGYSEDWAPLETRLITGRWTNAGTVNWNNSYTFGFQQSGFGNILVTPALAIDSSRFYIGVARKSGSGPSGLLRMFFYVSSDGQTWEADGTLTLASPPPANFNVQFGVQSGGTRLLMYHSTSELKVFRKTPAEDWSVVPSETVFGSEPPPNLRDFSVVAAGLPPRQ